MKPRGGTRFSVRVAGTVAVALLVFLASCGTLLYPERQGQPCGRIDPGVVVLDGLGLLLFFVPGVIAFVVDFATGAIYLPPEHVYVAPVLISDLRKVDVGPGELTPGRVEMVVREQTGREVKLMPGAYQALRLQALDEFTPQTLAGLQADPKTARVNFRAKGE